MFGSFLARSAGQPILGDGAAATPEARQAAAGGRESALVVHFNVLAKLGVDSRAPRVSGGDTVALACVARYLRVCASVRSKQMVWSTSQVLEDIILVTGCSHVCGRDDFYAD